FVAHRARRADADGLQGIVDPVEEKVEAAGAEAALLQLPAEIADKGDRIARDGFGRADRLAEDPSRRNPFGIAQRIDRLADHALQLVEPAAEERAEALDERRARHGEDVADGGKAEHMQA